MSETQLDELLLLVRKETFLKAMCEKRKETKFAADFDLFFRAHVLEGKSVKDEKKIRKF